LTANLPAAGMTANYAHTGTLPLRLLGKVTGQ
jgi:hypothetical protein